MEVHVVYRQRKKTGWFGRRKCGPEQVAAVYADETEVQNAVDQWNKEYPNCLYTTESWFVVYNHSLRKRQLLECLSYEGKELLGLEE